MFVSNIYIEILPHCLFEVNIYICYILTFIVDLGGGFIGLFYSTLIETARNIV